MQMWNRVKAGPGNSPGQEGLSFLQFGKAMRLVALAQSEVVPREETFKLAMDAASWRAAGMEPLPPPRVKPLSRQDLWGELVPIKCVDLVHPKVQF